MVHGTNPDEVKQDLEGMQVMQVLGNNMAYFINCKKCCIKDGNRNATGTGFCIYQFYTLMLIFSGRSLIAAAYILYMKEQVL